MRSALKMIAPNVGSVAAEVAYPKGSIVVCHACGVPLYRLVGSIWFSEKTSNTGWKYAPVSMADLQTLMERRDLDPGIRAAIKLWSPERQRQHCERIPMLKNGELPNCPSCAQPFVYALTSQGPEGKSEFTDRAYVLQLATIPPVGKARPLTLVGGRA